MISEAIVYSWLLTLAVLFFVFGGTFLSESKDPELEGAGCGLLVACASLVIFILIIFFADNFKFVRP